MRTSLFVLLVASACGGSAPPPASASSASASTPAASASTSAGVQPIDGATAHQLVAAGAVLVDVRSPDEYQDKHIQGAVDVPLDQVAAHDFGGKDKSLVFYCSGGHRSKQAVEKLRAEGYTHVYLLGAMSAWGK